MLLLLLPTVHSQQSSQGDPVECKCDHVTSLPPMTTRAKSKVFTMACKSLHGLGGCCLLHPHFQMLSPLPTPQQPCWPLLHLKHVKHGATSRSALALSSTWRLFPKYLCGLFPYFSTSFGSIFKYHLPGKDTSVTLFKYLPLLVSKLPNSLTWLDVFFHSLIHTHNFFSYSFFLVFTLLLFPFNGLSCPTKM